MTANEPHRAPDPVKQIEAQILKNMVSPEKMVRAKTRTITNPFVADMKILGQLQAIPVEFDGLNKEARSLFLAAFGEQPKLDVKLTCTAENFRVFWDAVCVIL